MKYTMIRKFLPLLQFIRSVDTFFTLMGACMVNITYFKGQPGEIDFECDPLDADGQVQLREFGDSRDVKISFRISNRWLLRHKRRPSNLFFNHILSEALTAGYKPAYIIWDGMRMMPYNVAPLKTFSSPYEVALPEELRWEPKEIRPSGKQRDPLATIQPIVFRFHG